MDFQLKEARLKYEREQQEKKDAARRRIERERRAREAAEKRRAEMEEDRRLKRLEEVARHELARLTEERDLSMGGGARYSARFRAVLATGSGDKITLPASALSELDAQGVLDKGPMFFQLQLSPLGPSAEVQRAPDASLDSQDVTVHQNTHAGVLEFTAPEGCVSLPSHVWRNLGLDHQNMGDSRGESVRSAHFVNVKYVRLPKAASAVLQPLELDFAELANHKAVLETSLRMHATLTAGDVLTVHHQGLEYELRVKDLKPEEAVTVIETDMEVEVVPPESGRGSGGRALTLLVLGKDLEGSVKEGAFRYYKFVIDDSQAAAITNEELEIIVTLQKCGGERDDADADLYLSAHPTLYPSQHTHLLSSHDAGTKTIILCGKGPTVFPGAGVFSVGVYGYRGESRFKLLVEARPREERGVGVGQKVGGVAGSGPPNREASGTASGFAQCGNCLQLVPERTVGLHEAFCRRHNALCGYPGCRAVLRKGEGGGAAEHAHCEVCGQAMRSGEVAKHVGVFHKKLKCECGVEMEMEAMVQHKSATCPLRSALCRFCGDMRPTQGLAQDPRDRVRGLTQHESGCGSRTAPCDQCQRSVMLKDLDLHMEAVHSSQAGRGRQVMGPTQRPEVPAGGQDGEEGLGGAGRSSARLELLTCPVCEAAFRGVDAARKLNEHLDEHFEGGGGAIMDVDPMGAIRGQGAVGAGREESGASVVKEEVDGIQDRTRSMKVECPICREAVHSERDLSRHIDIVH